jgi:hypothetical protein
MSGYRELHPARIHDELRTLARRIDERFAGSSLGDLARELTEVSAEQNELLARLRRPNWLIRAVASLATAFVIIGLVVAIANLPMKAGVDRFVELVAGIESAINDVIFIALAIFFLFTLEGRLKRRKALASLHELRSIAHIVDMHQLTKDPEQVLNPEMPRTTSSPVRTMTRFELARYLDYCSELLSLAGKLASLYAQYLPDPVVLTAVNEVENLTVGLARKVWQKIMILDTIDPRAT